MEFLRTRRLNMDAILKILLLGGFAYFFYQVLDSGRALLYINPKMIPFVNFAILAMLFMILVTLPDIFTIPRRKIRLTPYTLFFIPLLLSAVFPAVSLDSGSLAGRSVDMGGMAGARAFEREKDHTAERETVPDLDEVEREQNQALRQEEEPLVPVGGRVVVDEENYVTWLYALYLQPEEHAGLELEISGFVYKNEELEPGTFMLSRLIMVCCAADMQLSGLLCHFEDADELEIDKWLQVNGSLTVEMFKGRPIPAIAVEQITEIERPEIPYVFPP